MITHKEAAPPCHTCRYYFCSTNGRNRTQTPPRDYTQSVMVCNHPDAVMMIKTYSAQSDLKDIEAATIALCAEYCCVTMATARHFCEIWTPKSHKSKLPPPPLTAPTPPQAPQQPHKRR